MKTAIASDNPFDELSVYEIRHLCTHLLETGGHRALHRLLELEDSDSRNAWFRIKSRMGETNDYLTEMAAAWNAIEDEDRRAVQDGGMAMGVSLQLRYAFITSSLAEMAAQPSAMVVAFLEQGLWTPKEVLAYAFRINSWQSQLQVITALSAVLTDGGLRRICERRALELIKDGPKDFPSRTTVSAESESEFAWSDYRLSAECLDKLATTLSEDLLPDAVAVGKGISNWFWLVHGLRTVCGRLGTSERRVLAADLWGKAADLRLRFLRSEAYAIIAPLFDEPEREVRIQEALLEAVDVLNDQEARRIIAEEPRSGIFTFPHAVLTQLQEDVRALRLIAPHASVGQLCMALEHTQMMDDLPVHESLLVLLPELARTGRVGEALERARGISHSVYRNIIISAIAPFLPEEEKNSALKRAIKELKGLKEPGTRSFCLSMISSYLGKAQRGKVLLSVLKDVRRLNTAETESLCTSILMNVATTLSEVSEQQRHILASDAFGIARRLRSWDSDSLTSTLVPSLSPAAINREFQDVRNVAFGRIPQNLQDAWAHPVSMRANFKPKTDYAVPANLLLDALGDARALREHERSRLIVLGAPLLGPESWQLGIDAARSITSEYLRSLALCALTRASPDSLRVGLALEAIQTIWTVPGGLEGAAPMLNELVTIVANESRALLFDPWSTYLRALSHDSLPIMVRYLEPVRSVIEALGGHESANRTLDSLRTAERWFGKRKASNGDESESLEKEHNRDNRFHEDVLPSTTSAIAAAIIELFVQAHQFERAQNLLTAFRVADVDSNEASLCKANVTKTLFRELSNAGQLDKAMEMLSETSAISSEGVDLLVRRLISHGQRDDAHLVFETTRTRYGPEAALPLACLLLESDLAEGRLSDAMSFFGRLEVAREPGHGLDCYTDMAFMLGNVFLRNCDKESANHTTMSLKVSKRGLRAHIAARLVHDASRLRDKTRAAFWYGVASELESQDTIA